MGDRPVGEVVDKSELVCDMSFWVFGVVVVLLGGCIALAYHRGRWVERAQQQRSAVRSGVGTYRADPVSGAPVFCWISDVPALPGKEP